MGHRVQAHPIATLPGDPYQGPRAPPQPLGLSRYSLIHVDLPVGLAGDVKVGDGALVVLGVDAAQHQLAPWLCVRVPVKEGRGSRLLLTLGPTVGENLVGQGQAGARRSEVRGGWGNLREPDPAGAFLGLQSWKDPEEAQEGTELPSLPGEGLRSHTLCGLPAKPRVQHCARVSGPPGWLRRAGVRAVATRGREC